MQVHPDLARLRSNGAPQPACDAALAAWRALPHVVKARAALARLAAGEPLEQLQALARLVRDHAVACAFVADFVELVVGSLRAEPLAQVPLGHSATPGMARLRLIEQGRCCLTLTALAQRPHRLSPSALFEDGMVHELVVAGEGEALVHHLAGRTVTTETIGLEPGVRLVREGPGNARQIIQIQRP
ncbi:MAG: hypothetical protein HC870_01325, partial [Rhizobiales bacterium]|nr:hypothetical protein [Hyphomicrobiales bacterium]